MNIDEMIVMLQQRKEERGLVDVTTLEYSGGGDAVCDVVNLVFDEETGTLRVLTAYRYTDYDSVLPNPGVTGELTPEERALQCD